MVHVKYPSMERQDLTQGQLGSFKFTPVDEVYPDAVMFPQPHPLLVKQYIQSLKTAGLNDERFRRPTTASSSGPSSHDCDVNPALDHSRFRPRSVISQPGVGSRAIDAHGHVQEKVLSSYGQATDTRLLRLSDDSGYESTYTPEYSSSSEAYSSHAFGQSLMIALQNEQEAHKMTKLSLDTEMARRIESELEQKKLVEHNKNLLNSIRLLQSTVKHMVQKQEEGGGGVTQEHQQPRKDVMNHPSNEDAGDKAASPVLKLEDEAKVVREVDQTQSLLSCVSERSRNSGSITHEQLTADDAPSVVVASTYDSVQKTTQLFELPPNFRAKYGTSTKLDHESLPEVPDNEAAKVHSDKLYSSTSPCIHLSDPQHIDWKMASAELGRMRSECIENGSIQYRTPFSQFKRQPIRYMPKITERNIFRTCMVDFIPYTEAIKYSEVLQHIRGGALQSITMYGPIGSATDFVTARVIFIHEASATAFYERGQSPGINVLGQPVRVWQVMEPTHPPNEELEQQIYEQNYTRLLVIDFNNEKLEAMLQGRLAGFISQALIIDIRVTSDGATLVEFTSIDDAARALRVLMADPDFSGVQFDFEDDYCASRYDETTESVHTTPAT